MKLLVGLFITAGLTAMGANIVCAAQYAKIFERNRFIYKSDEPRRFAFALVVNAVVFVGWLAFAVMLPRLPE